MATDERTVSGVGPGGERARGDRSDGAPTVPDDRVARVSTIAAGEDGPDRRKRGWSAVGAALLACVVAAATWVLLSVLLPG